MRLKECTQCGGKKLRYNNEIKRYVCPYCGSEFEPTKPREKVPERKKNIFTGSFNWGDDGDLPEYVPTRSEKLARKIRKIPLGTWQVVRWAFILVALASVATAGFLLTVTEMRPHETTHRVAGSQEVIITYREGLSHPTLLTTIILLLILLVIIFLILDIIIWRCTQCHVWMSSPFIERERYLFYIGRCPGCESKIRHMINGEVSIRSIVDEENERKIHRDSILESGGWDCYCGKTNPRHTGTCSCGQNIG